MSRQFNLRFRMSDLSCRICSISKFLRRRDFALNLFVSVSMGNKCPVMVHPIVTVAATEPWPQVHDDPCNLFITMYLIKRFLRWQSWHQSCFKKKRTVKIKYKNFVTSNE
jgi:hypothetical protein